MSTTLNRRLQADLRDLGFYTGPVDGIWGPNTQKAWDTLVNSLTPTKPITGKKIAWGKKVSTAFVNRVVEICAELGIEDPSDLMSCMAWESGETFSASIKNGAGSGAVGLIQFMPNTAKGLGTSTEALARLSAEQQLEYVRRYFLPYKGRLRNLGDLYMAILWPAGVGKTDDFVLWEQSTKPTTYRQNIGLDINRDGVITRGECLVKVRAKKERGLLPQFVRN